MRVLLLPVKIKRNFSFHWLKLVQSLYYQSGGCSSPSLPHLSPTCINALLNRATECRSTKHAIQIHTQLIIHGYLSFPFLFNNLLNLYAKCGHLNQALILFSAPITRGTSTLYFEHKNIVTWTSIITQLSHHSQPFKALGFFSEMRKTGIFPNHFTFSAVLPACAESLVPFHGQQIHGLICKHGFEFDVFVGSALVDMYAKCGDMSSATIMFDEMPERNLVSWNAMIVGFLQNGIYNDAVRFFVRVIQEVPVSPDQVTFSSALSACANMGGGEICGKQIHGTIMKHGLVGVPYVRNSLMDMYFKCGFFEDGEKMFKAVENRDVVTWNIMVMGCVQNDNPEDACNYFWRMRSEGVSLDEASLSTALHAAAFLAALDQGRLIHDQIIKAGFEKNTCITSSLITMYAKCGSLADSQRIFGECEDRNVVSWTAMIAACQQHGRASEVIKLFEDMLQRGIKPDYITFVCVLSACSHTGRVDEGFTYFNSMTRNHDMNPGPEHYACMVDMLGRAGRLEEAKNFVETMPVKPDASVWGALLGACRSHGNLDMGREVAEKLFKIEPNNPGNYVLLSDMYTRSGKLGEAHEVRRIMGVNRIRKEPGCSWIDVKNTTYVFKVHDRSNFRRDEIYKMLEKLEELVKQKGYVDDEQNDMKRDKKNLWYHSERIALAFGLLSLPAGSPIRIKKNLRTCNDCHTVLKFASEIFEREIIVRDINRFHTFTNGLCSCGDYW